MKSRGSPWSQTLTQVWKVDWCETDEIQGQGRNAVFICLLVIELQWLRLVSLFHQVGGGPRSESEHCTGGEGYSRGRGGVVHLARQQEQGPCVMCPAPLSYWGLCSRLQWCEGSTAPQAPTGAGQV